MMVLLIIRFYRITMWKTIVFCAVLCLAAAEQATFENYKVFRITPNTENQVEVLQQLQEISDGVSRLSYSI